MMLRMIKVLSGVLLSVTLLISPPVLSEEVRYISSQKAKLLKAPQFKAEVITQLTKGEQIEVTSSKGSWLQVNTQNNQQGWISKFLTKTNPPTDRITVLPGEEDNQLKDVRRRTSALTTAAAARGLAARSANDQSAKHKEDKEAVKYMESFDISDSDLDVFAEAIRGDQ